MKRPYTTQLLNTIIKNKLETDALLKLRFPKAEQKFNRLTNQLHELLEEIKTVFPDANYTANGEFHLLLGNSHAATSNPNLVALSAKKLKVGDGD